MGFAKTLMEQRRKWEVGQARAREMDPSPGRSTLQVDIVLPEPQCFPLSLLAYMHWPKERHKQEFAA